MHSNLVYFVACLSLVCAGIIFGQIFNIEATDFDNLTKMASMLASIATIFGVIVAFIALSSWKLQYRNSKLDTLLDELEDSFNELYRAIYAHRHAQIMIAKFQSRTDRSMDYPDLQNEGNDKSDNYLKIRGDYSLAFDKFSRHHKISNDSLISPFTIADDVAPILQGIRAIYNCSDFELSDNLLRENEEALEQLWKSCKENYQELRGQVLLTAL